MAQAHLPQTEISAEESDLFNAVDSEYSHQIAAASLPSGDARWNYWKMYHGPLQERTDFGCGITALVYFGIITSQQGLHMLNNIQPEGTRFSDIVHLVNSISSTKYTEYSFPIHDPKLKIKLLEFLQMIIKPNTSIMIKLLRVESDDRRVVCDGDSLTSGHTCIFSKNDNNELWLYEPMQLINNVCCAELKVSNKYKSIVKNWTNNCFIGAKMLAKIPQQSGGGGGLMNHSLKSPEIVDREIEKFIERMNKRKVSPVSPNVTEYIPSEGNVKIDFIHGENLLQNRSSKTLKSKSKNTNNKTKSKK